MVTFKLFIKNTNQTSIKQIVLVVSDSPTDLQIRDAFVDLTQNHSITITEKFLVSQHYMSKDNKTVENIVRESCDKTRGKLVYYMLV